LFYITFLKIITLFAICIWVKDIGVNTLYNVLYYIIFEPLYELA